MTLSHLSGDNNLKLPVQSGGDGWTIMSWSVYRDRQRPLPVKQPMSQLAWLQLPLRTCHSDPLAFPNIGGRPSCTDLGRLLHQLPVAICSAMIDLAGGARHE
jgi:hypothetical protein